MQEVLGRFSILITYIDFLFLLYKFSSLHSFIFRKNKNIIEKFWKVQKKKNGKKENTQRKSNHQEERKGNFKKIVAIIWKALYFSIYFYY